MQCNNAQALVPSYLDGELSEAQAAPLRKHLLSCQPCRGLAQEGKVLKRWFVEGEPVAVPAGFAARVARRAFAGDTGESFTGAASAAMPAATAPPEGRLLRFVLQTTSLAAGFLLLLSIGLGNLTLPANRDMLADDSRDTTLDEALDRLQALDRAEPQASADEAVSGETGGELK